MEKNPNSSPAPEPGGSHQSDYRTIHDFIERTALALTNAQLPDIKPLLKKRGYSTADITAKLAENEALRALNEKQKKEYGEQYDATGAYKKAHTAVHTDYMDHLRLARVVFKRNTAARTALGLRGDRAATRSGYSGQGLTFYNNALDSKEYGAALDKKGISEADLKAGRAAFKNLQTLAAAQKKETGEAVDATAKRDEAYDALHDWMSDFYETAKVALREHPEYRKQLGM